jgi:hypothetical protein
VLSFMPGTLSLLILRACIRYSVIRIPRTYCVFDGVIEDDVPELRACTAAALRCLPPWEDGEKEGWNRRQMPPAFNANPHARSTCASIAWLAPISPEEVYPVRT